MTRKGYGYMLGSALGFAVMATLVGTVHRLQPQVTATMTSAVRAVVNLVLLGLFAWRSPMKLFGDRRPALWLRGLFGALGLLNYFAALGRISIGEASFLNQTSAVWVALLAPFFLKERSSRWVWLAILGAALGMLLLSYPRSGVHPEAWAGRLMGAASGIFAAFAYLMVRRAGTSNPPTVVVFYFTLVSALVCLGLLTLEPVVWPSGLLVWTLLVGVGVTATAGQILMTRAYQIGPAASMAVVAYASPLLTSLLGWLLLGQTPDRAGWLGMALILLCGVALPYVTASQGGVDSNARERANA